MMIKPFLKLFRQGQLHALIPAGLLLKPFYKVVYLAAAKESGVLDLLSGQPVAFDSIAAACCKDKYDVKAREALAAWLQMGVTLGLLDKQAQEYGLKGLARKLASPQNDALLALVQEAATLHHRLILNTPMKLQKGEFWQISDQNGKLTARSSRALEVFQTEAIDRFFPASGVVRLLEIGCGSAFYIRYAAGRNPSLSAVGFELQAEVAETARQNIQCWGLQDRVRIEVGDILSQPARETFDIITLYNNIYYFPVEKRVALLQHIKTFLKPESMLLLTTCCQGGNPGVEALNLWGAATATGGRLPDVEEMVSQLSSAGYRDVKAMKLTPTDSFYAFRARPA
jgi:SAM-dependent methyltransferase